jgi:hypothetical protein
MHPPFGTIGKAVKKLFFTSLVAVMVASAAAIAVRHQYVSRQPAPPPSPPPLDDALTVFCFRSKTPDRKSKNMETYTHEVLKKSFAAPMREGRIVWRVLCYEDPENSRFKAEFQVSAPCIVLADGRSDRSEVVIKNLQNKVTKLADDKEAFMAFVRAEIETSLK